MLYTLRCYMSYYFIQIFYTLVKRTLVVSVNIISLSVFSSHEFLIFYTLPSYQFSPAVVFMSSRHLIFDMPLASRPSHHGSHRITFPLYLHPFLAMYPAYWRFNYPTPSTTFISLFFVLSICWSSLSSGALPQTPTQK